MQWATQIEHLEREQEKRGRPLPALQSRPELEVRWLKYYEAFMGLNSHRQEGFSSMAPFSVTEIVLYLREVLEISKGQFGTYFRLVTAMDKAYRDFYRQKQAAKVKSRGSNNKPPRNT